MFTKTVFGANTQSDLSHRITQAENYPLNNTVLCNGISQKGEENSSDIFQTVDILR
jgi:hypothetical protein